MSLRKEHAQKCASYLEEMLDPVRRDVIATRACERILELYPETEAVACRGVSGILFGSVVAHMLNLNLCVVRKPEENCHGSSWVESGTYFFTRWIFLDDLVDTGRTFGEVFHHMGNTLRKSECLGGLLYFANRPTPVPYREDIILHPVFPDRMF